MLVDKFAGENLCFMLGYLMVAARNSGTKLKSTMVKFIFCIWGLLSKFFDILYEDGIILYKVVWINISSA